jgi:hypothetical protein
LGSQTPEGAQNISNYVMICKLLTPQKNRIFVCTIVGTSKPRVLSASLVRQSMSSIVLPIQPPQTSSSRMVSPDLLVVALYANFCDILSILSPCNSSHSLSLSLSQSYIPEQHSDIFTSAALCYWRRRNRDVSDIPTSEVLLY